MHGCMVGWSHSPFGKLPGEDLESLIVKVAGDALKDAGIGPGDVDEIFVGNFNAGLAAQDFPSSLALQLDDALRFRPATRVENACATGSAAIYAGLTSLAAKRARVVLAVGAETMTGKTAAEVGNLLLRGCYVKEELVEGGFPGVFARIAARYFERFGDQSDALAQIAAKNHKNGVANPYAQIRKDLGFAFCREASAANPVVAAPLKRTDCSLISDGAAAVVLTDRPGRGFSKAVAFRARQHANDFFPMSRRDPTRFEAGEVAWSRALAEAGIVLDDLSFAEIHDCFTVAELIVYEMIGLAPHGRGARAIQEGWTLMGGKLPVNPSGGLKAKGHPIGATGVSMHVLAAMQLTETAGGMQVPSPRLGAVFNMGGTAVANYVSVLERVK